MMCDEDWGEELLCFISSQSIYFIVLSGKVDVVVVVRSNKYNILLY